MSPRPLSRSPAQPGRVPERQALRLGSRLRHKVSEPVGCSLRKLHTWAHRDERHHKGRPRGLDSGGVGVAGRKWRQGLHPHCTGTAESVCTSLLVPLLWLGCQCRSHQTLQGLHVYRDQWCSTSRRPHGRCCWRKIWETGHKEVDYCCVRIIIRVIWTIDFISLSLCRQEVNIHSQMLVQCCGEAAIQIYLKQWFIIFVLFLQSF